VEQIVEAVVDGVSGLGSAPDPAPEPPIAPEPPAIVKPLATPDGKRQQFGDGRRPTLTGDGGDDALFSGEGRYSRLSGGGGNDYLEGNGGNDWLYGEGGDDVLLGRGGIDYLYGGSGDDLLDGGSDEDWLTGGSGADTFVLRSGGGTKLIWDFQNGIDSFGLGGGLIAADIEAVPVVFGAGSILRVINTQEVLATLVGEASSSINPGDFFAI
jgi:Ca2+-binding RTX toxin-like protein